MLVVFHTALQHLHKMGVMAKKQPSGGLAVMNVLHQWHSRVAMSHHKSRLDQDVCLSLLLTGPK